ncbi:MAG TPA: phospholipase D-like domain-containing protein [Pyrinomonadaceae bacterium]|jgi:cardiolipin synthase|nr:phospholipase D-like domain-containing protein [Pyrinomonadaceae bacterium]
MATEVRQEERPAAPSPKRRLIEQAYARATGAPLIPGNRVRLLRDAAENYPAWLEAIASARRTIHFESFIIHDDDVGQEFARALIAKAKEGVRVRLIYDWLGAVGKTSWGFWRSLRDAGVEVRAFNPPKYDEPFGWLNRDHRKMISVDGRVGYVMGLCVGQDWVGRPDKNLEPWRDTGVEIRGPALADINQAFARAWAAACGEVLPDEDLPRGEEIPEEGDVPLRVIASEPNSVGMYRLEQLVAAGARKRLWLTDAYFIGTNMYVRGLCAAARDGVDVRLLVPSSSDIPIVGALSRANYRSLLEAGVRVFEWNGSMVHAKTAVVDGSWARVGSTNLNVASWMGNWELDVTIEHEGFAREMEGMYLADLEHSTEVVLSEKRKVRAVVPDGHKKRQRHGRQSRRGSATRAAAGALGIGSAVGAAITNRRVLGPAEAQVMAGAAAVLFVLSMVAVKWPKVVAMPLAFFGVWTAVSLVLRAYKLRKVAKSGVPPRLEDLPGAEPSGRLFERGDGRQESVEDLKEDFGGAAAGSRRDAIKL